MRNTKIIGGSIILWLILAAGYPSRAVVLWSSFDQATINENGAGTDLLGAALKRNDAANDTLYFKFRVVPISDEFTEPYFAALELYEDGTERLGVGNALDAWAYSVFFPGAISSGIPPAGYLDLHSAHPDTNAIAHHANYQCPHRGEPVSIVFKIQYVPGSEDLVTVWLNPDLGPGANEINQPEALTTRFHAKACFDELRLRHGGSGGGWKFDDLAIATTFNDFVDSSSDHPSADETDLLGNESSLQFQSWLKNQGWPQLPVRAVQQTRDGYIWIVGGSEIERFDGLKFAPFNMRVAGTNHSKQVIFADSHGAFWFAAPGGLQRVRKAQVTTLTADDGLPDAHITALNEDAQGNIWVGTARGLAIWSNNHLMPLGGAEVIHGRAITAVTKDRRGAMWLVVDSHEVFKYSDAKLEAAAQGCPKEWRSDIRGLLVDHADRVWLSTGDDAVLCRDEEGWHRYRLTKRISGSRVNALAEEPDGTIWAGTSGGLFLFSKGKFAAVPPSAKLAGNSVESLLVDNNGLLWVGTDAGLNRLQHKCLFILGQGEGLGFGSVESLARVAPQVIWASRTGDGIYRWDGRSFSRLRAAGLSAHNSQANAMLFSQNGVCWVASNGGLLRYKDPVAAGDEVRWFELPNQDITSLSEGSAGRLWAGTRSGELWQLRAGEWIEEDTLAISNSINVILPGANDSIWLGTEGSGLIHLEPGQKTIPAKTAGLPSDIVRALFLDREGVLWIGTVSGLSCLHGNRISNFTTRDGLPSNIVSQISEDNADRLWLGTGQGIACLRKQQLEDFAAGRVDSLHPKVFNHNDGMPSEICTGGVSPMASQNELGPLWFPTTQGVAVVAPQNWPVEQPTPATEIEEIRLDGVPISADAIAGPLVIPPGKHRLEFTYNGLRFDSPEALRFRYQLEGWDAEWINAGTSRSAVYNFLPPGQYRFRVIACDSEGNWASSGAEMPLVFTRHFWQSWWFIGISSIVLLGAVGSAVRITERQKARTRLKRVEQERVLEHERTRIAQDLHDEMGAKLCRISFLSEHALRDGLKSEELQDQIKSISNDSREVLHSLDEIVWAVNPQNDTLEHAASYLSQYTQDYFSMTGVECELVVPAQMPAYPVSSQVRHHLFLAVREALANILKHSAARRAKISIACENGNFEITVEDNGSGFTYKPQIAEDGDPLGTHDGLRNMAKRFENVGGLCCIESSPGHGTTVKFVLPLDASYSNK